MGLCADAKSCQLGGGEIMPIRAEDNSAAGRRRQGWVTPTAVSLVLVAATTGGVWFLDGGVRQDHLIFAYFLPAALVAVCFGSLSAMGVAVGSSLAAAYFLYPPRMSILVTSWLDVLELTLFCLLVLLASRVVSGLAIDGVLSGRWRPMAWFSAPAKRDGAGEAGGGGRS